MTRAPVDARRVALEALVRIDADGAYANLLLPTLLGRSGLSGRDKAFATELVYGTTRMRRACDWLVDRFVLREVDPQVRAALRLGAYQLAFLDTAAHAAVSATVAVVPRRARGFVNAILRRVATSPVDSRDGWPSDAIRLSYPDWIVARLTADLGATEAIAALEAMNARAAATERADGYVQDQGSQWVAELVEARPGERIADVCAAPGGKATALAACGAWVVAADVRPGRARLVADNVARLSAGADATGDAIQGGGSAGRVAVVTADGRRPPLRPGSLDCVLVDAPCSGLGALRRRPDARWRVQADAVDRLAELQRQLVDAAVGLVRPGGRVVYSVCTLTVAESTGVDEHVAATHPSLEPMPVPGEPWTPLGRGGLLLPQAAGTDGMALFRWRLPVL